MAEHWFRTLAFIPAEEIFQLDRFDQLIAIQSPHLSLKRKAHLAYAHLQLSMLLGKAEN